MHINAATKYSDPRNQTLPQTKESCTNINTIATINCQQNCVNRHAYNTSLSTIVLNSRDWSEIVWLHEISRFKINLAIGFIRKKPTGMHWLGYNDAVSWLTKRKLEYFSLQPILKFSKFTCISSACRPASLPASLP